MDNEESAPQTKGVTVELMATVDLGPEIEGMAGRQLRMRRVTIAPGGVFGPLHDHIGRPGVVHILQGTITDHRGRSRHGLRAGRGLARGQQHPALVGEPGNDPGGGDLSRHRQKD